jgi:hypothetical protein
MMPALIDTWRNTEMGQVIEFRPGRTPVPNALYRCARCGTDLWNLLADGRVRCADCEEECPLRTLQGSGTQGSRIQGSGTAGGREHEMNQGE